MLRIGVCDDVSDARLLLRRRIGARSGNEKASGEVFSSSRQARRCSAGTRITPGARHCFSGHGDARNRRNGDRPAASSRGRGAADCVWSPATRSTFLTGTAWERWGIFSSLSGGAVGGGSHPRAGGSVPRAGLYLPQRRCLYRIPMRGILYFVSDRRQVTCVTEGRDYTFYGKLDAVAAEGGFGVRPRPPAVSGSSGGGGTD